MKALFTPIIATGRGVAAPPRFFLALMMQVLQFAIALEQGQAQENKKGEGEEPERRFDAGTGAAAENTHAVQDRKGTDVDHEQAFQVHRIAQRREKIQGHGEQ